ncbi:hypothetical protein ES703_18753 [subsurface metagenome]
MKPCGADALNTVTLNRDIFDNDWHFKYICSMIDEQEIRRDDLVIESRS